MQVKFILMLIFEIGWLIILSSVCGKHKIDILNYYSM